MTWPTRSKANYYRVQIFRTDAQPPAKQRLLFEIWTAATRLQVPMTWMDGGQQRRLSSGPYRWSVIAVGGHAHSTPRTVADGAFSLRRAP